MPWNDNWKDGYDAWKLREPDWDDDYDPELDCEHEDYDIVVCTGRASCNCCDHRWYLSSEEIDAELDRQSRYQEHMVQAWMPWDTVIAHGTRYLCHVECLRDEGEDERDA